MASIKDKTYATVSRARDLTCLFMNQKEHILKEARHSFNPKFSLKFSQLISYYCTNLKHIFGR